MCRPASGLLDCIERYFAAAPLPDARITAVGGLDVPWGRPAWPYPARPRPGGPPVTADDVRAAVALQDSPACRWPWSGSPSARPTWRRPPAPGPVVEELPLLVAVDPVELMLPQASALRRRRRRPRAPALPAGHGHRLRPPRRPCRRPRRPAGPSREAAARTAALRERIASGRTVMIVAVENGEPVAVGSHHPVDVDGDEVSEVAGVATLPRLRGRGWARACLGPGRARPGDADLVFLTAGDDDVARSTNGSGSPAWRRPPSRSADEAGFSPPRR